MKFFDIIEETPYKLVISRPENMEELSDLFVTEEELKELTGHSIYLHSAGIKRTILCENTIKKAVEEQISKLEASKKKTIVIDDDELLDILKHGYLSDYTNGEYCRRGNRLCYGRPYKRVKTKATQGDVNKLWNVFQYAFKSKFNCYPSHIPIRDRHLKMFKAWQQIVGWKRVRAACSNKEEAKFLRMIWDNPEEFIT